MRIVNKAIRLLRPQKAAANIAAVRPRILFVSHEATRTGAPLIILNILRHFADHCDAQCETILHNGGQIAGEFEQASHSVDCLNIPRKAGDELKKKIHKIVKRERDNAPILAICNSMESRFIGEEIASHGIPMIYLVHELPSSYSEEDYQMVYRSSTRVIFPAQIVRETAGKKYPIPPGMAEVAPQGLLNPKFGEGVQREQARRELRTSLGLPDNAFVVMGCGTLDLRKGIDHFASIAREMLKGKHRAPVHFVWVGDGPRWVHSPYHYVQLDLEQSGSWGHVHFIGERSDVEPYFFGADSFLLTSRVDPFPCVIHEAMAAALPIVTFSENGGAAEALAGGAGIIIPYGRYDKAAEALSLLCEQPELGHSIGQTAQEKVATQFRFETYAEGILQTAEHICRRSLRRGLRVFAGGRAAA